MSIDCNQVFGWILLNQLDHRIILNFSIFYFFFQFNSISIPDQSGYKPKLKTMPTIQSCGVTSSFANIFISFFIIIINLEDNYCNKASSPKGQRRIGIYPTRHKILQNSNLSNQSRKRSIRFQPNKRTYQTSYYILYLLVLI